MYTGEQIPWSFERAPELIEGAPEWALAEREALYRVTEIFRWWVTNRQIENGEMGGGWGDDCEMLRAWPIAIMAADDPMILTGWRRMAKGIWKALNLQLGYVNEITDVEHGAEPLTDTHAMMIGLDYGNPLFVERCMRSMRCMRDVWTGVNPKGHLLFRSHYFSATQVDTTPPHDTDVCYNARAARPGVWVAWYNRHPEILNLFSEWARSWCEMARRTDCGKPAGVIPAQIHFSTESFTPYRDAWYKGYFGWNFEAFGEMYDQLLATSILTGDETLAAPILNSLELCARNYLVPLNSWSVLQYETEDVHKGKSALRVKWSPPSHIKYSNGGVCKILYNETDLSGRTFELWFKIPDSSVKTFTVSFFQTRQLRAERHTWFNKNPGEWKKVIITVGSQGDADSYERNRGDLRKITEIIFSASSKEPRKGGEFLINEFREIPREGIKPAKHCEIFFNTVLSLKPGGELWTAKRLFSSIRPAVEKWRLLTGNTRFDGFLKKVGSPYLRWLLSENRRDKKLIVQSCQEAIKSTRSNFELLTSEVLFTDRIFGKGTDHLLSLYTGSLGMVTGYPSYQVTWRNTGRDFAALVYESRDDYLKVLLYSFTPNVREIGMVLWRLEPGRYRLKMGPDRDENDIYDKITYEKIVEIKERMQEVRIPLPPRELQIVEFVQISSTKGIPLAECADLAISSEDVSAIPSGQNGRIRLAATVHNIGAASAHNVKVTFYEKTKSITRRLGEAKIEVLKPPLDLEPSCQTVYVDVRLSCPEPTIIVKLSTNTPEITKRNNLISVRLTSARITHQTAVIQKPEVAPQEPKCNYQLLAEIRADEFRVNKGVSLMKDPDGKIYAEMTSSGAVMEYTMNLEPGRYLFEISGQGKDTEHDAFYFQIDDLIRERLFFPCGSQGLAKILEVPFIKRGKRTIRIMCAETLVRFYGLRILKMKDSP
ncbi:MAG TPA: hypothetical protein ENF86_03115 [Firmicutes bacterium]|nr:hypothetical protein [Bacillota bacterium]